VNWRVGDLFNGRDPGDTIASLMPAEEAAKPDAGVGPSGCSGCLLTLLGVCVFVYALASALGFHPIKWYHDRQASKTCVDHPVPGYYLCYFCMLGDSASERAREVSEMKGKNLPALCYTSPDGSPFYTLVGPYPMAEAKQARTKVVGRTQLVSINQEGRLQWLEP